MVALVAWCLLGSSGLLVAAAFLAGAVFLAAAAFLAGAAFLAAAALPRLLSDSLNADAGAKRTPLDAAILTGAPVWGLRPIRAARALGEKVPKPKIATLLPALVSAMTDSVTAATAASACFLSSPVLLATASTSSVLFTGTSWRCWGSSLIYKRFWSCRSSISLA